MSVYRRHTTGLADSRLVDADLKRLYIMDSTTVTLFKDIFKGVGRNPKQGGTQAHTIIKDSENVPCLIRLSETVSRDHMFLKEVFNLVAGFIITFNQGYVDYDRYVAFSKSSILYVPRLKDNVVY